MKKLTINNLNTLLNVLKDLNYGSVFVKIEDENVFKDLENYIKLVHHLTGFESLYLSEAIESVIENGEYIDIKLDDYHRLTWADKDEPVPVFTMQEIKLESLAEKALKESDEVYFNVRPELLKYASKIAKKYSVKFVNLDNRTLYSGKKRPASTYNQLEAAVYDGLDKIEFEVSEVAPQTVRVYASQIAKYTGIKTRVSVKDGKITVLLKEPSKVELLRLDLEAIKNKYNGSLGEKEMHEIIRSAFIQPDEYTGDMPDNGVRLDIESNKTDYSDKIKIVDGLKQYTMANIEEEAFKMDEDDEF